MESTAHVDVMKIDELIDYERHAFGVGLLERVVAMLTKMIDPKTPSTGPNTLTVAFPFRCTVTITGSITATITSTTNQGHP